MSPSDQCTPVFELGQIVISMTNGLREVSGGRTSKLLGYQITLLEVFDHEVKKLSKLGYCDYELAFVSYNVAITLFNESKDLGPKEFIQSLDDLFLQKRNDLVNVEKYINENSKEKKASPTVTEDVLLARFNKLTTKTSPESTTNGEAKEVFKSPFDKYKYKECISATELHQILSDKDLSKSVLLIDYRTQKEFDYNHINFTNLVNVDPTWLNGLDLRTGTLTDSDLDQRLQMLMKDDQYEKFRRRSSYELIVIYNLKFGATTSKFSALENSLKNSDKNGIASSSPFTKLVDLITFRHKYLSTKLKRHPVYLGGGVSQWFEKFGEGSISKTTIARPLPRPEATLSKGSTPGSISRRSSYNGTGQSNGDSLNLGRSDSPYLRNFSEYISTATSAGTPQSVPFSSISENSQSIFGPNFNGKSQHSTNNGSTLVATKSNISPATTNSIESTPQTSSRIKKSPSFSSTSSPPVKSQSPIPTPSPSTSASSFLEQYSTGLTNLGNSCYMNCVLQCLGATPQLTGFFFPPQVIQSGQSSSEGSALQSYRQHINVNNILGTKGILTTTFVTLLTNMFSNNGKFFTPSHFKKVIGSLSPGGQFASFDQQDCIEFLNFVLDGLHEDLNQMAIHNAKEKQSIMELTPDQEKTRELLPVRLASTIEWERYLKLNFSIVVDYFQGQYLSQLKCLECQLTSTTYNAFSILSLPVPERLGSSRNLSLDDCLKEFTTTELLDNNNKWHCPRCKKFTRSTKKISITRLPQVLIIHFKRFKISMQTGNFDKLNTMITYPVNSVLDLTSYWPEVGTTLSENSEMTIEKESQVLSTLPNRNQSPPFRYRLYGVVNHYGTLSTGHYTSYVYKKSDAKKKRDWCYFDDAKVTYNCKESQVLNANAYCLFYQRI
ncbi:ubiquitin carboxyl-terminal hydrolase 4 [[Candida] anglica]